MIDKLNLTDYEWERFGIGKKLAEEFLPTKVRSKAYKIEGYDALNGPDEDRIDLMQYLSLTDDEVTALKNYILECYNKRYPNEAVDNWETFNHEVLECVDGSFFDGMNETPGCWKELITDRLASAQMTPDFIDFDDFRYFYRFSCYVYDAEDKKMYGPISFIAILSDEEYCILLALQLVTERGLTYNNLWLISPELARIISGMVANLIMNDRMPEQRNNVPFLVLFDELIGDAEKLKVEYEKRVKDDLLSQH